jgi:uncharacterized membrane protein required for colicin V production
MSEIYSGSYFLIVPIWEEKMNWCDLVVIGIILGFAIYGMYNGFIMSIFKLLSFVISLVLSFLLYPYVSKFLMGTALHGKIKEKILDTLIQQQSGTLSGAKNAVADKVVESLSVPGFLKDLLKSKFPDPTKIIDLQQINNVISEEMTKIVIYVISMILLYVLVRAILVFAKFILGEISKLPVFKQVDKVGGFAFGGVEGFLTVYIIFTILMIFSSAPAFKGLFDSLGSSTVAKYIFEHNFIFNLLSGK